MAGDATETEQQELMALINTGHYEQELTKKVTTLFEHRITMGAPADAATTQKLDHILERILDDASVVPIRSSRARVTTWRWMAAATVALLIGVGLWYYAPFIETPQIPIAQAEQGDLETYQGRQFITLADGSTVLLNENSRLTYDAADGQTRKVVLVGEAYFDVAHNEDKPFVVHTGNIKTTVLGTAFNIKAYDTQEQVVVTVTRGKVAVGDQVREYEKLLPNEQLAVHTATQDYEKTTVNSEDMLAWKQHFILLDQVTMAEAATQLAARFKVTIDIKNEALKPCIMNGTFFDDQGLEHIIKMICRTANATYRIQQDTVTIEGGAGCL